MKAILYWILFPDLELQLLWQQRITVDGLA